MVHSHDFYNLYQTTFKKYTDLYGKQVCVFLKKGSFYEFYGQETPANIAINTAKQVMELFAIAIHVYPTEAPEGNTGFFGGVPDYTLDKWAGKLTRIGWTVVVIDEIKNAAGKIRREVSKVLSPGTHIESAESSSSFFLSSLWLDGSMPPKFGVASADLTTGQVFLYEGQATGTNPWHTDDLRHFFQVYPPRELVLYTEEPVEDIRRILHIPSAPIHSATSQGSLAIPLAREQYLRTTFQPKSALPLRTWLHTSEDSLTERALCNLLRFAEDHAPGLASCLQAPHIWHPKENVQIINNALTQLNLIKNSEQLCVEDLFTSPITTMGKRSLTARLCTPLTDIQILQARQEQVQWMVNSTKTHSELKTALSLIADTARLHRSIQRGTIRSADVVHYSQSYRSAIHLSKLLTATPFNQNLQETLESTLHEFELIFDVEKARKEDQDLGFLQSSTGPKTEQAEKNAKDILMKADTWLSTLKKAVNDPQFDEGAYFKPTDKSMFILHSTKSAQRKLEAMLKQTKTYPKLSIKSLTSNSRIEDPALDALEAELDSARGQLKRCLALEVPQACIVYSQATRDSWQEVEDWIVNIDLCLSMARTAIEHGWTQPILETNHQSRVKIDNLRHPLIEAQKTQSKYVTHSISLGHEDTGWLLYGMNASGKSSLMKAIGIAVLLAQVGSYVPATSMTITPFHKIATRILNQDNLWAGLSSFAVEMSELRDIFQVADTMTLVLGDELCSGTESISATAIVAAGIEWLHKCGTRFVLATHLHDLTRLQRITTLPTLRIWHLHVEYDRVRDILVYHRELKSGPGSSMYGLEVARALHLPHEMIEAAFSFRRELTGATPIESASVSSWNSDIVKQFCGYCGSTQNLDAHHIQERHDAINSTRNQDGTGLHHSRNLTVLCKSCHAKHHSGDIHVGPVEDTSEGPKQTIVSLKDYEYVPNRKPLFTEEELEILRAAKRADPLLHPKLLVFQIQKEHGLTVTEKQLKSI